MFEGDERRYLDVGLSAIRCIRHALAMVGAGAPRRILDLPCGHGRVLRALRVAWPEAELTACDLARDGVDFCARTFGARPVYSEVDPRAVALARESFDLIWVGSLLTHLDRERWSAFLECFHAWLAPEGLLVFTTLGRYAAYRIEQGIEYGLDARQRSGLLADFSRDGFGYRDYPGQSGFGLALASPPFVTRLVMRGHDARLVTYGEALWDDHQDVVGCQKLARLREEEEPPSVERTPHGARSSVRAVDETQRRPTRGAPLPEVR